MTNIISSRHNEKIRFFDKLKKPSNRKKFGLFLIEGLRELTRALSADLVEEVLFCPEFFTDQESSSALLKNLEGKSIPTLQISANAYQKVSLRENGDGFIGIGKSFQQKLQCSNFEKNPLFIATENIEKPSNFGAIIRTAESAGIDGIIVLDESTEVFNPNVIRSSQGSVFFAKIFHASSDELIGLCEKTNTHIFVTSPSSEQLYFNENFSQGSVILVGSEDKGVSEKWLNKAFKMIKIPQIGKSDSLNVSVATGVVLYECIRQRLVSKTRSN